MALANQSSRALVTYVHRLNKFNPQSRDLLQQFQRASRKYSRALAARRNLGPSAATQARVDRTRLEMHTKGDLYRYSQAGQATPNTLQVLALAADADSDLNSILQRAIFAGVIGGLLIGAASQFARPPVLR